MSWKVQKEFLFDKAENIILIFSDNISSFQKRVIISSDFALDLIGEFVMLFDNQRTMSKQLFENFSQLIERSKDYNVEWEIDNFGNLLDEINNIIGFLPEKNHINSYTIKYSPEMHNTIFECIENFEKNNSKQKYLYKKFCEIQRKIIERV